MNSSESRQLRGVAEILRGNPSPALLEQLAAMLETIAGAPVEVAARALATEVLQVALPLRTEPAHVQRAAAPERTEAAPDAGADDTSTTCADETAAPSSSSPDLHDQEKKSVRRLRPHTDDPLPDPFRAIYAEVVAERGVALPSAEYVWSTFVEDLWARDRSFTTPYSLRRAWRSWVVYERPIATPERAPETPAPASRPRLTAERADERQAREELRRATPAEVQANVASVQGIQLMLAGLARGGAIGRAPPEPRSLSA